LDLEFCIFALAVCRLMARMPARLRNHPEPIDKVRSAFNAHETE
jgi:hypothetical protein